tara:strand:- start:115127 stop:116395 length:1269 start_codon:yes stop_codon:yes gene_type:complete
MNILVLGSGGREHALAWKIAQSNEIETVYVASGNAGTAIETKCQNIDIAPTDSNGLIRFVKENNVVLTIVGPEAPLAMGVVDDFQNADCRIFGPSQLAAQLESSKTFSKDFMTRHNIPTAFYDSFTDIDCAKKYIQQHGAPIVVKADGLAAGKGVVVAQTEAEAFAAIEDMLADNKFGDAGSKVIIEEFLSGEEASFIVMSDGEHVLPMATSQDHKARDDGDKGPNTGGMGAYSPAPVVTDQLYQQIMEEVIAPTIKGMAQENTPYVGFLYAGVMITREGPKVLEYNCRFGDPETQPIMMRLQSDLVALCEAALDFRLNEVIADWDHRFALGVVMASNDYPAAYPKGETITGLNAVANDIKVFHAGTALKDNAVVTNGGRVLCVTALGDDLATAKHKAYDAVANIQWGSEFYRHDIGDKGIA